ncbi:MAG: hypothetical protein U0172_14565 [Nitrospiraceae bacterium]
MSTRHVPRVVALCRRPPAVVALALAGLTAGLVWQIGDETVLLANSEGQVAQSAPASNSGGADGATDKSGSSEGTHTAAVGKASSLIPKGPATTVPKEVLNMLDQRKRFLDQREDALRSEQARLEELKRDLSELLDRYEGAVKAFEAAEEKRMAAKQVEDEQTKKRRDNEAAARQASLEAVTKIYEAMPAEDAAARLEKLPVPMAVNVLRTLKSKTAGAILANVGTGKAAKLSEQLYATPAKDQATNPAKGPATTPAKAPAKKPEAPAKPAPTPTATPPAADKKK